MAQIGGFEMRCSREDLLYEFAMHVGEAEITAGVAVGEALVVNAEEVQDGGVDVVNIDGSFDRKVAEVVELAVAGAGT